MTRMLCLWLPNWAIQRATCCRPELKGRPVALVVSGPRGGEVAACCSRAVEQGLRPGMPLVEAQSLVRELGTASYEPEVDRRALVKCAEACECFSPRVAIEDEAEPESLLLDISNLDHIWNSEERLVEQVQNFFTRRGYLVRSGLGETVGAAWAAAHFEKSPNDECRMTNEKSADSSFVIRHSSFTLPVQSLRIPEEIAATLRELGIETIDQLVSLPRDGLAARFGGELLRRMDQLTGAGREVIEPRRALNPLEASCAFEEPTANRDAIAYALRQLVEQLARQLAARDQGAVLLNCSLYLSQSTNRLNEHVKPTAPGYGLDDRAYQLRIGLLQPSASPRQLMELIELHLENTRLASEVERIELRVAVVGRLGERQGELFADSWPTDPHQLAVLVNRLSSRLGSERVLRAELRASPVPERALKWQAMMRARNEERGVRRKRLPVGEKESADRNPKSAIPLLLYPAPQAVEVISVSPDGPPQAIWLEQRREVIASCVGPERIETLWWRGPIVRRDYYRTATTSGQHLWIFRQITNGRWFIHGIFG